MAVRQTPILTRGFDGAEVADHLGVWLNAVPEHRHQQLKDAIHQACHQVAVQVSLILSFLDARHNFFHVFRLLAEVEQAILLP